MIEDAAELKFTREDGETINAFVREGDVAAHLLLGGGKRPRILVAFPAGNSSTGIWFTCPEAHAAWQLNLEPCPATLYDAGGRRLNGCTAVATIRASRLSFERAVLSSTRFLRLYHLHKHCPGTVEAQTRVSGSSLIFERDRLDGAPGYYLCVEVLKGQLDGCDIVAGADGLVQLRIVAATGEPPLAGLAIEEILNEQAGPDLAARQSLAFLSYREKFLAGSWRFNSYFGRDTLLSLMLLMPVLREPAIEMALGSVLARLGAAGEVAHEEGIGEFAILSRLASGNEAEAAPILDYEMVDDDFLLAPVIGRHLLDRLGLEGAAHFLGSSPAGGDIACEASAGALLVRNFRLVLRAAAPFAAFPIWQNLVALKPDRPTGEWRDSTEGLGQGRYPFSVNAVLVPAALRAIDALCQSGLLASYLMPEDNALFSQAGRMAKIWERRAPGLFHVEIRGDVAAQRVGAYAGALTVDPGPALASIGGENLRFHALALDARGAAVPVLNSDAGFALLFASPDEEALATYVQATMRPFPAGLMTGLGMMVANPAFADAALQGRFGANAYHGSVVWSWQQAMFAAGLERQLARGDISGECRALLRDAQRILWDAIDATRDSQDAELWSWRFEDGRYLAVPFGADARDLDEANACQLWSTVYLAVRRPASFDR